MKILKEDGEVSSVNTTADIAPFYAKSAFTKRLPRKYLKTINEALDGILRGS